ncbi:hypothetical protein ACOME3_000830 [Neoechinorhynchus agilis]
MDDTSLLALDPPPPPQTSPPSSDLSNNNNGSDNHQRCHFGSPSDSKYTIRGALSFLESRYYEMEKERATWNLQRVEYEAQLALLRGRNHNQLMLVSNLVRRIQMLEHALRMERMSHHDHQNCCDDEATDEFLASVQDILGDNNANGDEQRALRQFVDQLIADDKAGKVDKGNASGLMKQYLDEIQSYSQVVDIRSNKNRRKVVLDGIVAKEAKEIGVNAPSSPPDIQAVVTKEFEFLNVLGHEDETDRPLVEIDTPLSLEKYFVSLEMVSFDEEIRLVESGFARSHLDTVRTVAFHPTQPLLVTGSDDTCVRVFSLKEKRDADGGAAIKRRFPKITINLARTYRYHRFAIICVEVDIDCVYSGDLSGLLCRWRVPSVDASFVDPYDPTDRLSIRTDVHTDSVNGICLLKGTQLLVTFSTDHKIACLTRDLNEIKWIIDTELLVPVDACLCKDGQLIIGLNAPPAEDCETFFVDPSKGQVSKRFKLQFRDITSLALMGSSRVAFAFSDMSIQFYDLNKKRFVSSVDGCQSTFVTQLAGRGDRVILSVSHEGTMRIWHRESKEDWSCCQQMTVHRTKLGEGALCVALHSTLPFAATGGADNCVRVLKVLKASQYNKHQQRDCVTNSSNQNRIGRNASGGISNRQHLLING